MGSVTVQAHEKGRMTDPEDEIAPGHGPDPLHGAGNDGGQRRGDVPGVVLFSGELPLQKPQEALLVLGHPGIEESSVLEVGGVEILDSGGFDFFSPARFIEFVHRAGQAGQKQT